METRERVIYNVTNLWAGSAPATGYNYIDAHGIPNNNDDDSSNANLLMQLDRVQNVSFSFNNDYQEVKEIGRKGTVARKNINTPTVNLSFSYLQNGVKNECRLGINADYKNYRTINFPFILDASGHILYVFKNQSGEFLSNQSGELLATQTTGIYHTGYYVLNSGEPYYGYPVCPFSGFEDRTLTRNTKENYFWPYTYQDTRNIYVAVKDGFEDVRYGPLDTGYISSYLVLKNTYDIAPESEGILDAYDYNSGIVDTNTFQVYGFGNCYLNSYRSAASVNSLPVATVSYICENVSYYLSGSGCGSPAVNTKTNQTLDLIKFNLPKTINEGGPSVLLPSNISLDVNISGVNYKDGYMEFIVSNFPYVVDQDNKIIYLVLNQSGEILTNQSGEYLTTRSVDSYINSDVTDLGINISNLSVTNYDLNVDINRDSLYSLGFRRAIDRPINFPIYAKLDIGVVFNNIYSGSLANLINNNYDYNLDLRLKNPCDCEILRDANETAIHYMLKKSKLNSFSFNESIGSNASANLSFSTEINPDDTSYGFFMSGLLNIDNLENLNIY